MHLHKPSAGSVITKITIPASLSLCCENAWPPDSVHGTTSLELTHVLCRGHRLSPAFAWYNPQALNQSWVHLLRCVSVAALSEARLSSVPGFVTETSKTDVRPLVTLVGIATRQCCLASLSRLRNGHKACRWIASLLLKHNAVFCRFRGTNHERQVNTPWKIEKFAFHIRRDSVSCSCCSNQTQCRSNPKSDRHMSSMCLICAL